MAKADQKAPAPDAVPEPIPIVWDTEDRNDLAPKEGHVRDNLMYLTTSLVSQMEFAWGGVLSFLKTSTNVATGEVTLARALQNEPGSIPVRRLGAQNAIEFNFWRPLRKLNLKVPADRQFNVKPFTREVPGHGTLFVFPMNQRESVPRNLKEEEASKATAEAAAASQTTSPAQTTSAD